MFTMKEYVAPQTLEEAYNLLIKGKQNRVIGGMMWMRMGQKSIHTGIDLGQLGLDAIIEDEAVIKIGAMCTLRQVETSQLINAYDGGLLKEAVKCIVGVQFRNTATVGGSVYGRYGFSDVLTALLAVESSVELYKGGIVPLEQFLHMPYEKDIVIAVHIAKDKLNSCYLSERLSATDFPILTVAISKGHTGVRIVVGARPFKAAPAKEAMDYLNQLGEVEWTEQMLEQAAVLAVEQLGYHTNMRASQSYREHLAHVLIKRGLRRLEG